MSKELVLFVNSKIHACGVHQYGFNIYNSIKTHSKQHEYMYVECSSQTEFLQKVAEKPYVAIIYNFHPSTIGWATAELEQILPNIVHVGIVHEPNYGAPFTYKISQDPSFEEAPPYYKQHSRNIFDYDNTFPEPEIPTIGSFGFAWADKGFERMISQIKKEFDLAKVRLHLPRSYFGDPKGALGTNMINTCNRMLRGTNITLEASREWKTLSELLDWLAQNTINAFFYEYKEGRGISGPPDFAMAVKRPMILTKSYMFKHLWEATPSIFIEDVTIKECIANGLKPLEPFYARWSEQATADDYDRVITLARYYDPITQQ